MQIFHTFLFIIRNYSLEVINVQRREAELHIKLPRVNDFDIKQKKGMDYHFIIVKPNKTQKILVKTSFFIVKTELRHI